MNSARAFSSFIRLMGDWWKEHNNMYEKLFSLSYIRAFGNLYMNIKY